MPGVNSDYSPLPQSNSDSDGSSEEELRVPQESRVVNRTAKSQNAKTEKTFNGQKHNVINYKPLDNDGSVGVTLIKFQSTTDEVSVLKTTSSLEMFSTSRKICFVFSLLLCIFTTVVFIWVLPCDNGSCPNSLDKKGYNYTWEETFQGLEIYGPISIVPNSLGRNQNLIFFVRTPLGFAVKSHPQSFIMCLHGKNGSLGWNVTFNQAPTEIDCKLIDVNADGYNDCLVFGKHFLRAVNPISGRELWDVYNSSQKDKQLLVLDFPLVVPDLDADGVKDLLLLCSFGTMVDHPSFPNYLVIISGRTGTVINKPLQIRFCSAVYNLIYENSSTISYTCYNSSKKESLQTVNLMNVFNIVRNDSVEKLKQRREENISQHQKASNTVYLNGFRLTLDNQGSCPEDCIVLVNIKNERGGLKNKTVYSLASKNTFGMTPVSFKSKEEFGFLLKLWEWHSKKQNNVIKNSAELLTKRNKLSNSLRLEEEMLSGSREQFNRFKRTASKSQSSLSGKNVTSASPLNLRLINETLIKITFNFNGTQVHVDKIMQDEVIQICKKPLPCQPDAYQQMYSAIVYDLNEDGREELIVFNSKYVHEEGITRGSNETWQLHSRIQVKNY